MKKVKDHLGNEFYSIADMCKYWGIMEHNYNNRVRVLNWSLEKALTTEVKDRKIKDHLGNSFNSTTEMCKQWNITRSLYLHRVNKLNWSVKRALTTPAVKKGNDKNEKES